MAAVPFQDGPQPPAPNIRGEAGYAVLANGKPLRMLRGVFRVVIGLVDFGLGTGSFRADGPAPRERGRVVKDRSATGSETERGALQ